MPPNTTTIPVHEWTEESYSVAIQTVRSLSAGQLTRDPQAKIIHPPPPFRPQIVEAPRAMRPIVRGSSGSVKFQKWMVNTAAKKGMTLIEFKAWRSHTMVRKYYKPRKKVA